MITSDRNVLIKTYRKLKKKKWRYKENQLPLEGFRLIKDAFENNVELTFVLYTKDFLAIEEQQKLLDKMHEKNILCKEVAFSLLEKTAFTETPQGILAVCNFRSDTIEDLLSQNRDLLVVDQVQDPGNLGTLIRSADVFGFSGVVCIKGSVDPTNEKVIRSSMGSLFHIPIVIDISYYDLAVNLKNYGYKLLLGDLEGKNIINEVVLPNAPLAVYIGNETRGIQCTKVLNNNNETIIKVKIPMIGKAESLNAGVAGSIILYELARKRFY